MIPAFPLDSPGLQGLFAKGLNSQLFQGFQGFRLCLPPPLEALQKLKDAGLGIEWSKPKAEMALEY